MNPLLNLSLLLICVHYYYTLLVAAHPNPVSHNITVLGSVYCDACSNDTFSKHSYFLKGAKVLVECKFKVNSASKEEMYIMAYKTTDKFGVYKLEIPPVDGLECRQGREIQPMCKASLIKSSNFACNVTGMKSSSTQHYSVKSKKENVCYYNLDAMSYRPAKVGALQCSSNKMEVGAKWSSSLFFWPILPPFEFPWQELPFPFNLIPYLIPPSILFPFPHIPFPDPSTLPFPIPSWLLPYLKPPYFPFPLFSPTPSSPVPPTSTQLTSVNYALHSQP